MFATLGGVLLGLVVGVRHAFEPDHLAAVSTLVTDARDARRGALLGAIWGLGHTLALVAVGIALLAAGALVPARLETALELAVAVMLIALGIRALVRAARDGRGGPISAHAHGQTLHRHAAPDGGHLHVGASTLAWRPLAIGVIHGLAGSGGLTALVFAELPSDAARVVYIVLFGAGSIAGMALASGLAGLSLARLVRAPHHARRLGAVAGALSIAIGVAWGVPLLA
ncbi:MAG: high-affinity nickel-transport family protein [Kofleriaceae bacterium]|nr:high-affinity nickel-transport family protein [Kofleriaceae bacterium]MCL4224895.1 high-affinity nickel-transport family protein [Myxococcales bacterium]